MLSVEEEPFTEMLNKPDTMETPDALMEDLLAKTNNLTVLDEDGWEINTAGGKEAASFCAMGRFCANRPINRSLLRTILGRVWGIDEKNWGVEIKHTIKEASFLVFSFKSSQDLDRILTKNPWFLNNGLLIVERMAGIPSNWGEVLTKFPLSGRVLQLPTRSITQGNLNRLAGFPGEIIEVQKADITKIKDTVSVNFGVGDREHFSTSGPAIMSKANLHSQNEKNIIVNPTIQEIKNLEKGKTTCSVDGPESSLSAQLVHKKQLIMDNISEMAGISGKKTAAKRSCSWSDKELTNTNDNNYLCTSQHNIVQKESLNFSPLFDPENLSEVPITYDTGCESVKKIEGPSKRRRIVPKRSKTKKGNKEPETTAMNSTEELSQKNGGIDFILSRRGRTMKRAKRLSRISGDSKIKIGHKVQLPAEATVNSLLQPNGSWKENEVRSCFHSEDVPWVLGIQPSINRSDWLTWSLTPNGMYSVASGYKLRFRNPIIAECSNKSRIKAWWKFLWGSHHTPKMKNFIWRVFNHWIPTKMELAKRGMALDTKCNLCTFHDENICHALWHCPKVKNIWKYFGFHKIIPTHIQQAADVLWWLKDHLPKENFIKFMGLTWLVWQRRNNFVFQHKIIDDKIWTNWALDLVSQHLEQHQQPKKTNAEHQIYTWKPPPPNVFLINTDASLILGQAGCGLSAVIRDHNGALVVAETTFLTGCLSVMLAEAIAIKLGIKLAIRWSIKQAQVGSDSQFIIQAIQSAATNPTEWGQQLQIA
ncbi:hypothetical protein F8388_013780 [Cannabis sativa]|uniref:Reverse transcriptase zinc-binding domain-containing protein n=1 Tax=Cannabis sativa TaxID=3483 RepID=A0A7J6F4D2_CANSA|nr:hypothetical protein F8388_013780 [Cannabis sativa]